mgnify:CR=1 FL=1
MMGPDWQKKHRLETERLLLRPFTMNDVADLFVLGSLPELIRYTGNRAFASLEAAASFMQDQPLNDYQIYGYGRLACIHKATGKLIGFSGLKYLAEINEAELGYRLLPAFWKQGLATEAAKAVLPYAKSQLGLSRIVSLIHPDNEASKNVVKRLGFNWEKNISFSLITDNHVEQFAITL